jgi:uncharacterized membrane protein
VEAASATLLVVQSLALGLGAIRVYGIARRELGSSRAGLEAVKPR